MKMFRKIANIIPKKFHPRALGVAVTVLLRAILNFFGIAMLVPLLMLILDADAAEMPNLRVNQGHHALHDVGKRFLVAGRRLAEGKLTVP